MSTTTVPETLRAAATHIEEVGLYQGGNFFAPRDTLPGQAVIPFTQRPCCAIGAIGAVDGFYVAGKGPLGFPQGVGADVPWDEEDPPEITAIYDLHHAAQQAVYAELTDHGIDRNITVWSDDAEHPEEVVAVLRAAADRYERTNL